MLGLPGKDEAEAHVKADFMADSAPPSGAQDHEKKRQWSGAPPAKT